jgi:hypothetical protein
VTGESGVDEVAELDGEDDGIYELVLELTI